MYRVCERKQATGAGILAMQTVDRHTWIAAADLVLSEWRLKKASDTHGMHREHQLEPLRTIRIDHQSATGSSPSLAGIIRVAQNTLWLPIGSQVVSLDLSTMRSWSLPLPSAPESIGSTAPAVSPGLALHKTIRCATLVQYRLDRQCHSELWLVLLDGQLWIWPIHEELLQEKQDEKEENEKPDDEQEEEAEKQTDEMAETEAERRRRSGLRETSEIRPVDGGKVPDGVQVACIVQATDGEVWGGADDGSLLRWDVISKQLLPASSFSSSTSPATIVALAALCPPPTSLGSTSHDIEQRIVWAASCHPSLKRFHLLPLP